MLLILSALLFSLSSNFDNLVLGIAYGLKRIKIDIIENVLIAIIISIGTFLSMIIGSYITKLLPIAFANKLGAVVIIILGSYFTVQSIIKFYGNNKSRDLALKDIYDMIDYAEKSDLDKSGDINIKEAVFVAFGLTLNNLGTGIAASVTGVSIYLTVVTTFILSIILIAFGQSLGSHIIGAFFGKYAPLISGILLIVLGIVEFIN